MDRPNADPSVLEDDLNNLRVINKYFGGLSAVRRNIIPLLKRIDTGKEITILDLATGSADHPLELVRLAKTLNRQIHITAVDKNPVMLKIARERVREHQNSLERRHPERIPSATTSLTGEVEGSGRGSSTSLTQNVLGIWHGFHPQRIMPPAAQGDIMIAEGDVLNPQYPDNSYDIVLCSLAIHHFSREDVIAILRQMNRLSRVGFIVNDLSRSRLGAWTAWVYTHITTRNPMTLYDSYISVLRAFTPKELTTMAEEAGIGSFTIKTQPFFRLVLVGEK